MRGNVPVHCYSETRECPIWRSAVAVTSSAPRLAGGRSVVWFCIMGSGLLFSAQCTCLEQHLIAGRLRAISLGSSQPFGTGSFGVTRSNVARASGPSSCPQQCQPLLQEEWPPEVPMQCTSLEQHLIAGRLHGHPSGCCFGARMPMALPSPPARLGTRDVEWAAVRTSISTQCALRGFCSAAPA